MNKLTDGLHSIKDQKLGEESASGVGFRLNRMQKGQNIFTTVLHASPAAHTTQGIQLTDILYYLGLRRGPCNTGWHECYSVAVRKSFSLTNFAVDFFSIVKNVRDAEALALQFGASLYQPEGWGFFLGVESAHKKDAPMWPRDQEHVGHRIDSATTGQFELCLTEEKSAHRWVIHVSARSEKKLGELAYAAGFLSGWGTFDNCPEMEFKQCIWRQLDPVSGRDDAIEIFRATAANYVKFSRLLQRVKIIAARHTLRFLGATIGSTPGGRQRRSKMERRDIFICHASEDKADVVELLVAALREEGISCWYDKAELLWGDSIIEKINQGLSISLYVLVVLSEKSIQKRWPRLEFESALSAELAAGKVRVLPLLVGDEAARERIFQELPLLRGKLYLPWTGNASDVIAPLKARLGQKPR